MQVLSEGSYGFLCAQMISNAQEHLFGSWDGLIPTKRSSLTEAESGTLGGYDGHRAPFP